MPRRLIQLFAGLVLYGVSDSMLLLAGLGVDPWDVLHQGLARRTGVPIGTWAVIVGAVVLLLWIPLRQRPGLGTLCNVVLVGTVIDVILAVVTPPHSVATRAIVMVSGVVLNGVATGMYIGAGLGPGPRDGLMTGYAARGHSLRVVRTGIEATVLLAGWLLGGTVGVGTVVYAACIGPLAHVFVPLFSRSATDRAARTVTSARRLAEARHQPWRVPSLYYERGLELRRRHIMRAAGVRQFGGAVEVLELPGPRGLRADEILLDVRASGVGNWDEFVRTGSWDVGISPPVALGVEAAGLVAAVGTSVDAVQVGDQVTTHSVPLREQGSWAQWCIVPAEHCAVLPSGVSFEVGAVLPVPALTADQVVSDALMVEAGQTVLVHGAGGVTGGMLVQLAVHHGATVIATGSPEGAERLRAMGAADVVDYHRPDWPGQVRLLTNGGVDAAANAVPTGSGDAVKAVRDGGRLATITADPPAAERGITTAEVQVVPDGARLSELARLAAQGVLTVSATRSYPLEQAGEALARARHGAHGKAIVLYATAAVPSRAAGTPGRRARRS